MDSELGLAVGPFPQEAQQGLLWALWFPQRRVQQDVRCGVLTYQPGLSALGQALPGLGFVAL